LKLLAWNDRGLEDSRDARDFALLLRSYSEAGNEDRLYGDEISLLEAVGYNIDLAGARLLGKDAARIVAAPTRAQVVALLNDPARRQRLAEDMARRLRRAEDRISEAEAVIAEFRHGLAAID
jgi:predicted nucleotidyltransferase